MRNKTYIAAAIIAAAINALPIMAKAAEAMLQGTLSDSMCKANHAAMLKMGRYGATAASCIKKCAESGSKIVLIEKSTKTAYVLQNAAQAKPLIGKNVSVMGHVIMAAKSSMCTTFRLYKPGATTANGNRAGLVFQARFCSLEQRKNADVRGTFYERSQVFDHRHNIHDRS